MKLTASYISMIGETGGHTIIVTSGRKKIMRNGCGDIGIKKSEKIQPVTYRVTYQVT